jgi:peptide/nickel transport system ATP-binding protein
MAILFITHDLGLAREIADDILVMKQGNVVESGPVDEIFHSPKDPYTRGLLACRPSIETNLRRLPTINDFTTAGTGNHTRFLESLQRDETEHRRRLDKIYANEPLLRTSQLKTWFKFRGKESGKAMFIKAVDDVSIDIYPGEVFGLVGESGCGKTTLGRTILRLAGPTSGSIQYDGSDITAFEGKKLRNLRKDIQIIFQDPYSSLNPRLTAGSAIMEPMKVHGIGKGLKDRKERTMQLLEKVRLERAHFHRYPHEFSGGQRQRVCIARALAVEPEFIVCDESVSALDVSVQAQVLNLLADLRDEFGLTYIFISHDLSVVHFISDRIAVMKEGKIESITSPPFVHPLLEERGLGGEVAMINDKL